MIRELALVAAAASLGWPAAAAPLRAVYPAELVRVVDGDTFVARVQVWPGLEATPTVRLHGVDAPEIHGRCDGERQLAAQARDKLAVTLANARAITLSDLELDKYGRLLAVVTADGADVSKLLAEAGLARPYDGGARGGWCP